MRRLCADGMSTVRPKTERATSGYFHGALTSGDNLLERGKPMATTSISLRNGMIRICLGRDWRLKLGPKISRGESMLSKPSHTTSYSGETSTMPQLWLSRAIKWSKTKLRSLTSNSSATFWWPKSSVPNDWLSTVATSATSTPRRRPGSNSSPTRDRQCEPISMEKP